MPSTGIFFALNIDRTTDSISSSCHQCQSVRSLPVHPHPQSSTEPPTVVGASYAADVMCRYCQHISVLRETVSSHTSTKLIDRERHDQLCNAILTMCAELRLLGDIPVTIRVDPAPGFVTLVNDPTLKRHGIHLQVGQTKNCNKNLVAERAIEELGLECLRVSPEGDPISEVTLALATGNMNRRIRRDGFSAREVWTQRDQLTGEQLPMLDRQLIFNQNVSRKENHAPSTRAKSRGHSTTTATVRFCIGDLVFLKGDRDKCKARDKYMVTQISRDYGWCQLRKFTSSQLRSKTYDVRVCNCYLVAPTIVGQAQYCPVGGQESTSGSESDSEPTSPHHLSQVTPGSIVPIQGTISQQEISRDTKGHALSESIMLPTSPEAIVRPPDTHTHWHFVC